MNVVKEKGICTSVPEVCTQKDDSGKQVLICRYVLAVPRARGTGSDYLACTTFGTRARYARDHIAIGTEVYVEGHLHTELQRKPEGMTCMVTVTVDYQKIIMIHEKTEKIKIEKAYFPVIQGKGGTL